MKGISVVERHFEKAATLVVALCVVGYLAWDFLSPTTFKMGVKSDVTPATANEILLQKPCLFRSNKKGRTHLNLNQFKRVLHKKRLLKN